MRVLFVTGSIRGCGVDFGEDVFCFVERGLGAGAFGFGQPRVAEEHSFGVLCVFGPDLTVPGVVGGLGATRRVTHPDERFAGLECAGEFQAQGLAGVGEPAVVVCLVID
jgi:hypothetical protein